MADRMHQSHNFPQNFTHNSYQQPHIPQPPPRSQYNPRANPAPSEFGHPVCPAWRDTPVRDPFSHEKRDGNVAGSHNHQMQGSVRGPVRSQHDQGRPVVQQNQQYIRPNAQGINHFASYDAQVIQPGPQPDFLARIPSEHMNARQQTNPRVFNTNTMNQTVMHEADMNKRDVSRYPKRPSQEETVHFNQPGHGAQHTSGPNHFTSTSLQPSRDHFPPPAALPVGDIGRSTIPGNQPMRGPKRMTSTEFQEKSYLHNGTSQSDDSGSTHSMGSYPQTYTRSTASDPPMQQRITHRRAETDQRKEAYYGGPSSSDMSDTLQQFERLRISGTQVVGSSTQTYQTATAMIPTGGIVREGAQKPHGYDLDRISTGISYDVDLCRYITREGDYAVAGGGYADVFTGTLSMHQRATKVAIKAIKVYPSDNNIKKKFQRLLREIEVWKKLDHHSVLKLLGTTSGFSAFPAMVCPWLENGTLTSYLERLGAELQVPRILMLIHEVASGLQYLHSQSVVHGDLSGSNVLVDAKGQAYIADFGLSTILHESGVLASVAPSTGKLRATLRWAAPELLDLQDEGSTKNYTKPSDIYSFGSIMLQILSGDVPYHYYSRDAQVVAAISRGETTKRPNNSRVTERRWMFIQQCWSPFSMVYQRPSSDEIVAFSKDDLVGKEIQVGATGAVHGSRYPTL